MNACILSIGDELVLGQTIDTNSAWISQQLAAVGCDIVAHATVGDGQDAIIDAIHDLAKRADVLVISGGIGPTEDDMTRQALAAIMEVPLERNDEWMGVLEQFFSSRNRPMPEINKIQAMIPRGATMIYNRAGTAAGIRAHIKARFSQWRRDESGKLLHESGVKGVEVFSVPGVPKEMKAMFTRDVLPWIAAKAGGAVVASRTLHTFGLGESAIAERIGSLMMRQRNPSVGTTVSNGFVSLRLNVRAASRNEGLRQLDETEAACRAALGELIFGKDDESFQAGVIELLKATPGNPTIATAESCTGGLVAKMLTDVSGSSEVFRYGWVTYANAAKTEQLGVNESILIEHGAVSESVAIAMAEGARVRANATYALSLTGIAGPDGGTADKPVGTVWIALASPTGTTARRFVMSGDREMIRDRSAKMALTMLRFALLGKPLPF